MKPLKHKNIHHVDLPWEMPEGAKDPFAGLKLTNNHDFKMLYYSTQQSRIYAWDDTVRAFEANPGDFYNAHRYVDTHPMFYRIFPWAGKLELHERSLEYEGGIQRCVHVDVVRVDPTTSSISEDRALNTKTEIWIEAGEASDPCNFHDYKLDCGGDTYEEAIIALALNIYKNYGNDRRKCEKKLGESVDYG